MADGDFIEPPSWLVPPASTAVAPEAVTDDTSGTEAEASEFVELPPGVSDSATHQLPPERQRTPSAKPEVVFFPVTSDSPVPSAISDETIVSLSRTAKTWRITITGESPVAVYGVLYLGRDPIAPKGESGARALAVSDSAKSVSKTHARLEVEAGELFVHDLDSTNGVWVVPAGEDAIEVTPGQRMSVPPGADLELGDLVIQVELA